MKAFPFGSAMLLSIAWVQAENAPITLPTLPVHAGEYPSQKDLPAQMPLHLHQGELSRSLAGIPGVQLRKQGHHAGEPIFRGLGWERVQTQFNGLPLHGACPSRMDPPASYFRTESLQSVAVDLSAPSVIHGPGGLGGRIRIRTRPVWDPAHPIPYQGETSGGAQSAGKTRNLSVLQRTESEKTALQIQAGYQRATDYFSADGTRVPAGKTVRDASADFGFVAAEDLQWSLSGRWIDERDIRFPALPMDNRSNRIRLFSTDLHWQPHAPALRELEFRLGYGEIDHVMDNRDKPNRHVVAARTPATSRQYATGLLSIWQFAPETEWRLGLDGSRLERDAVRTRQMPSGMRFEDPIWPDLQSEQIGAFAEWERELQPQTRLRAGLRVDHMTTEAKNADARIVPGPGVGPLTIRNAYRRFGGADSGEVEQDDLLVSGNLWLQHHLTENWLLQTGLSRVAASPNLTQRYRAFGAAPGGFDLGNPDLDPEIKHQIEARLDGQLGKHRAGAALHMARVDDYILRQRVALADVNGDGMPNQIRGYQNEDALLYGVEASALLRLPGQLRVPLTISWLRGETRADQEPLPEMPPMEIEAALRWEGVQETEPFLEFGLRSATRQTRVNEAFGENETPSFTVFHIRSGFSPRPGWRIETGVENLFNRNYHEHLTREAVFAGGDLSPGDEIPEPERSFYVSLRFRW
ncbi:MAG: TonB-dependent receptor [Verrucomicrobia bacterium]|nr:TonB-dependent receptor [Verrucomicrobiota bacterium]MCH8510543.1 TonB-dependent receptor [Kiritimatiellia bacterium]